jgi:hypothetical protein
MTNMQWINEARSSLLCVGTNDGAVRVWRDVLESNASEPTLVTALNVLPDITPSDRGSGLVFDWLQSAGKLIAGGNSPTVRACGTSRTKKVCRISADCATNRYFVDPNLGHECGACSRSDAHAHGRLRDVPGQRADDVQLRSGHVRDPLVVRGGLR